MALKKTKVTEQKTTESRSRGTGHARFTEKPLAEFANTSKSPHQLRGLFCEQKVLEHFLNLGFALVAQRYRSPFGEIDLLMHTPEGLLAIIEVKSNQNSEFILERMSRKQNRRLQNAF